MFIVVTLATKVKRPYHQYGLYLTVETNNLCGHLGSVQCINKNDWLKIQHLSWITKMLNDFSEIQLWIKKQLYLTWQSLWNKRVTDVSAIETIFQYSNWNGWVSEWVWLASLEHEGNETALRSAHFLFYLLVWCKPVFHPSLFSLLLFSLSTTPPFYSLLFSKLLPPTSDLHYFCYFPFPPCNFLVFHPLPILSFFKERARDKERINDILPLPDSHPMAVHYQLVRSDCCIMEAFREPRWH